MKFTIRKNIVWLLILYFIIISVAIIFINSRSFFLFIYFLIITLILSKVLLNKVNYKIIFLYLFFSSLVLLFFISQYSALPEYYGFSGGRGIGTDDASFYYQVADTIPSDFPVRHNKTSNYANLIKSLTFFSINHPLDILFVNVIPLVFIPIFTSKLSYYFFKAKLSKKLAFISSFTCFYLITNGVVLVRDAWVAFLFIISLYYLIKRKYLYLSISTILLFYLRIASGILLIFSFAFFLMILFVKEKKGTNKNIITSFFVISFIIFMITVFWEQFFSYLRTKSILDNLFFRELFLEGFMSSAENTGSIYYLINQQNPIIRIPLASLFYFGAPYLDFKNIIVDGVFRIRALFFTGIYPFILLYYFYLFIKTTIYSILNKKVVLITLIFSFYSMNLILSQASMQFRHKTMLMPLFYVIISGGVVIKSNLSKKVALVGTIIIFVINLTSLIF